MPPPISHDVKLNFGRPDIAKFILDALNATPSAAITTPNGFSGKWVAEGACVTGGAGAGGTGTAVSSSEKAARAAAKRCEVKAGVQGYGCMR